jgi:hypothetical protein
MEFIEEIKDYAIKVQSFMDVYASTSKDIATTAALCGSVGGLMIGCCKDLQDNNIYDPGTPAATLIGGSFVGIATLLVGSTIEIPLRYFSK